MFLDDMNFGFEPKRNEMLKPTVNCIWPLVIAAGISAAAGLASSLAADDAPEGYKPEVLPETKSGQLIQDMNFVFDLEAGQVMKDLTEQLNEWSGADRDFFENTFQPFQASLIEANQVLIAGIVENAGAAMKSSLKDLMGGDFLKEAYRQQIGASGADVSKFAQSFSDQIDKIPTADQRVGEAVSGVEQRFGEAGAELKRQMGAKGMDVSEAGLRQLAISKAGAKAGATGVAQEAARKEQLAGAAAGVEVAAGVQTSQASLLTSQQQLTQTAAMLTPQVGGVQEGTALSSAGEVGATLTQAGGERVLGTDTETKSADFTQKGIAVPKFFDKETGEVVTASGQSVTSFDNEMKARRDAMNADFKKLQAQLNAKNNSVDSFGGGPGVGTAGSVGVAGSEGSGTGGIAGGGTGEGVDSQGVA
jgi:hypothetical protein